MRNKYNNGFTLIELLIVVAILSVLLAITIPIYFRYVEKTEVGACLSEAKAYANRIFYQYHGEGIRVGLIESKSSACASITDASTWDETTINLLIEAKSKHSTAVNIKCDLSKGANCIIVP